MNEVQALLDSASLSTTEHSFITLLNDKFSDFHNQGDAKKWDYIYSQTQRALIRLDFLFNRGENFRKYVKCISDASFLISLAKRNLIQLVPEALETYGLSINKTEGLYKNNALLWAIANNACDSAIKIISYSGSDLSVNDVYNKNALHFAIMKGRSHEGDLTDKALRLFSPDGLENKMNDVVCHLILTAKDRMQPDQFIIYMNSAMRDGKTPLHLAAMKRDKILYDQLIHMGADPLVKDRYGLIAEKYFCKKDSEIKNFLLKEVCEFTLRSQVTLPFFSRSLDTLNKTDSSFDALSSAQE
ncbi:Ankyrin repeats (3 copies) [Piscirickettsiaceae bacterium NZ-RLO1]|nr:Ankyrin repeats (3 copies) [Piscirickettsiaceae bacterium NZ-RLO1]